MDAQRQQVSQGKGEGSASSLCIIAIRPAEKSLLIFTVSDAAFLDLVASHRGCYHGCPGSSRPDVDPFLLDPLLQRLVVACQIAAGDGTPEPKDGVDVATVGGRTIRLTEDAGR